MNLVPLQKIKKKIKKNLPLLCCAAHDSENPAHLLEALRELENDTNLEMNLTEPLSTRKSIPKHNMIQYFFIVLCQS